MNDRPAFGWVVYFTAVSIVVVAAFVVSAWAAWRDRQK